MYPQVFVLLSINVFQHKKKRVNELSVTMSVKNKGNVKTRKSTESPIFGLSKPLTYNVLPTYEDVLQGLLHKRYQLIQEGDKNPQVNDIVSFVAKQVEEIGRKASVPTSHHYHIIARLK